MVFPLTLCQKCPCAVLFQVSLFLSRCLLCVLVKYTTTSTQSCYSLSFCPSLLRSLFLSFFASLTAFQKLLYSLWSSAALSSLSNLRPFSAYSRPFRAFAVPYNLSCASLRLIFCPPPTLFLSPHFSSFVSISYSSQSPCIFCAS